MKTPSYTKYDNDEKMKPIWRTWWNETYGDEKLVVDVIDRETYNKMKQTWDKFYLDVKAKAESENVIVKDAPSVFYNKNDKLYFMDDGICLIFVWKDAKCSDYLYTQIFQKVCFSEVTKYYVYAEDDWLKIISYDTDWPINVDNLARIYISAYGVIKSQYDVTLEDFDQWLTRNFLEQAIVDGDLDTVKHYHSKGKTFPQMMEFASLIGNLKIVKFFHSVGVECSPDAMDNACTSEHFDVFVYLSSCGYLYTKVTLNYLAENTHDEYIKMLYVQNPDHFNKICFDVSNETYRYLISVIEGMSSKKKELSDENDASSEESSEERIKDMCVADCCNKPIITRDHEFCRYHFLCSMCDTHEDCQLVYKTILCCKCKLVYEDHNKMYMAYIQSRFPSKFQMWCWATEYLNHVNAFEGLRQVASKTNYKDKDISGLHTYATLSEKLCEDVYRNVDSIVMNREIGKDIDIAKAIVTWMIA